MCHQAVIGRLEVNWRISCASSSCALCVGAVGSSTQALCDLCLNSWFLKTTGLIHTGCCMRVHCSSHWTPHNKFPLLFQAFPIKSKTTFGRLISLQRGTALPWLFILVWNSHGGEKLGALLCGNFPSALSPSVFLSLPPSSPSRWPTLIRQTVIPQWATFSFPLRLNRHTGGVTLTTDPVLLVCWLDDSVQRKGGGVRAQGYALGLAQAVWWDCRGWGVVDF